MELTMKIEELNLFYKLTEQEIKSSIICSRSKRIKIRKNQYIFREEDAPRYLYFVLLGTVSVGQSNALGKQNYIEYLKAGQSFGETDLFLSHESYGYFAEAKSDVEIFAVSKHFFHSTCEKNCAHHNKMIYNMMRIFAMDADKNSKKIQLLTSGTLRQRISYYLMQQRDEMDFVHLVMKREDLAAYLNTTRPSLSRELSYLQDKAVVRLDGRSDIKILDIGLLQNEVDGS